MITGRREKELKEAAALIGRNVTTVTGDVTRLQDLDRLYAVVKEKHSHIDILFANAGWGEVAPLEAATEAHFDKTFDLNVKGLFFTAQKALPLFKDGGSIILNSSVSNVLGVPVFTVYAASKAAVRSFARGWASMETGAEMGNRILKLGKYSVGTGDRFAHQAKAQLQACIKALDAGVEVVPVWNKSNREHAIIGSEPGSVRQAADAAVKALDWRHAYFCDADHITVETVGRFLDACDFFTIDVADSIGHPAQAADIDRFVKARRGLLGMIKLAGVAEPIEITHEDLTHTAQKFLAAVKKAGEVYRTILSAKGEGNFIQEVSMDETDTAQSPVELLIILAAIADEGIPVRTIAPKFSGRFNKGVDYVGDVTQFEHEFALDIAAIAYAVEHFGLPGDLKLSVHSGSDKFSIYPAIHRSMRRFDAGVHLKTAGTTWLEELIGLAEAGGDGLALAKEIYGEAYAHSEELCAPYASVIDIDPKKLPAPDEVRGWTSEQYTSALRHVQSSPAYNPSLRQLLHVGFKIAAKMGRRYLDLLEANEAVIARNVTENLYDRHIVPVFLGSEG